MKKKAKEVKILTEANLARYRAYLEDIKLKIPEAIEKKGILEATRTISKIQAYQNSLIGYAEDVAYSIAALKALKNKLTAQYEEKEAYLLVNDPKVKKQSSKELRFAKAHEKKSMRQISANLLTVKNKLVKSEALLKAIKDKYEFLEGSYEKLSREISAVKTALLVGGISELEIEKITQGIISHGKIRFGKKNKGEDDE